MQMQVFPDNMRLIRIDPAKNAYRFYRVAVMPDLFGGASLVREWGRIGTAPKRRIDLFPDQGQAITALLELCHKKRRRGYVEEVFAIEAGREKANQCIVAPLGFHSELPDSGLLSPSVAL